jgi:hypothetical protein
MTTFALILAGLAFLIGVRLLTIAFQTAVRSQILTRQGMRYKWRPVPSDQAWQRAFRDGMMGALFIVLGIFMLY